jgi:hypothetical protein
MNRVSVGLASSCLSLQHARFAALNRGGGARVRVYTKPCRGSFTEDVSNGRSSSYAIGFGPSLQRGRRFASQQGWNATQWARTKPEPDSSAQLEQREDNFGETNLLNARELAEKLVKEDGSVKRFVKGAELDRESFTRVFDVAALRVPADACGVHVSKLQGHLLNWPRVKNVPRVEGDDGDAALKSLLWEDDLALDSPARLVASVRSALYSEEPEPDTERIGNKKQTFPNLRTLTRGVGSGLLQALKPRRRGGQPQHKWEDAAVKVEVVEAQNHDRNNPGNLLSHFSLGFVTATLVVLCCVVMR